MADRLITRRFARGIEIGQFRAKVFVDGVVKTLGGGITYEAAPGFLEHLHHEIFSSEQGELLWDE